uniref:RRM domain-containing protein n=1 Tax=Alexandrium monilatum TaxID=311494 RepID=A0A7S4UQA4_9DINO
MPSMPGMPGMPGAPGTGLDPAMAQAYAQMLSYLQQGMPPPGPAAGMGPPAAPFPGMAPCPMPPAAGQPEPTVRVSVEGMKFQYQLTEDDIHKVFRRYGRVMKVTVDEACSSAMVTFQSTQEAQAAISDLDGKVLNGLDGTLRISWVSGVCMPAAPPPYAAMPPFPGFGAVPQASAPSPWPGGPASSLLPPGAPPVDAGASSLGDQRSLHVKGAKKYTGRFLIGIENDKEFQVARRLIGSKGCNMKRIVKQTEAKLRLRGVGSGYFEGSSQKESPEPLQLCVSCTSLEGYKIAVQQVRELLQRVYEEYKQFCLDAGEPVPDLQINLSERRLTSGPHVGGEASDAGGFPGGLPSAHPPEAEGKGGAGGQRRDRRAGRGRGKAPGDPEDRGEPGPGAPSAEEIRSFVNERNNARRACNFVEADRIRELLRSRGVVLQDEPGGRGKGAEVTTWRYTSGRGR